MLRPRDPGSHPRGPRQTNPHARGTYKKPGELPMALSLHVEARGLFLQPCRGPATQARTRGGSANNLSFRMKRMREGRTKKIGKLLISLLLRAEARGLFLQPSRGPATRTRTRGLGKRDKHPSFQIKRMREGRTKKTGKLLIALLLRAEAQGLFLQPNRGSATQTHTHRLGKRNKTPPSERKGCTRATQKRQGDS